jgi:hypothetical protein
MYIMKGLSNRCGEIVIYATRDVSVVSRDKEHTTFPGAHNIFSTTGCQNNKQI